MHRFFVLMNKVGKTVIEIHIKHESTSMKIHGLKDDKQAITHTLESMTINFLPKPKVLCCTKELRVVIVYVTD